MGLITRLLVPRSVRRAAHPLRTVKSKATPKSVKRLRRVAHPIDSAVYATERSLTTSFRSGRRRRRGARRPVFTHPGCPIQHRTAETAKRCRHGTPYSTLATPTDSVADALSSFLRARRRRLAPSHVLEGDFEVFFSKPLTEMSSGEKASLIAHAERLWESRFSGPYEGLAISSVKALGVRSPDGRSPLSRLVVRVTGRGVAADA